MREKRGSEGFKVPTNCIPLPHEDAELISSEYDVMPMLLNTSSLIFVVLLNKTEIHFILLLIDIARNFSFPKYKNMYAEMK